ncbi:MAG: CYTH domain-containing protein [Legionellales bacterium]|nr:CYTH domain-containing protein [Legionellales bacterium]
MNIELEIKLAISDAAIVLLKQHPMLQKPMCPSSKRRLISTYFDTPDKQLRKQGYALRIRQDEGLFTQTLKGRATAQFGLTARNEWEWPLEQFALDFSLIPVPELKTMFSDSNVMQYFSPRFTTDFIREAWDIELSDQTLIEVALDRGIISVGEHSSPIQELELELKKGNPETLKAFANLFQVELGLSPENRSKAARGFALC